MRWVRLIYWNTFHMSMDIRVKLSDWDRHLRVWNIWTPSIRFRAIFTKAMFVGWLRVIAWNTFQKSMDIRNQDKAD